MDQQLLNDSLVNDRCSQGKSSNARTFPAFASVMSSNMSLARTSLRAKPKVKEQKAHIKHRKAMQGHSYIILLEEGVKKSRVVIHTTRLSY